MNNNIFVRNRESDNDSVLYLDSAGRSLQPLPVTVAGQESVKLKITPWEGSQASAEDLRILFGKIISSNPSNIAICPSTSFAMSTVAFNAAQLGVLNQSSTVLVLEDEMGSVMYPWQQACRQSGASLKVILDPRKYSRSPVSWTEAIIEQIDDKVSIIALPMVHWCDGSFIDLAHIRRILNNIDMSHRPWLVIDGTQSIGALEFHVDVIQPTFLACSVHKWLQCPYGMSFMYLDPSLHDTFQPIDLHERNREGSDRREWDEVGAMNVLRGYPEAFMSGARRIDSGGRPNPILLPMIQAGLSFVLTLQVSRIQSLLQSIVKYLIDQVENCILGKVFAKISSKHCHYVGFRLSEDFKSRLSLPKLVDELLKRKIKVSVRYQALRVSPYIYIDQEQIDRFIFELTDVIGGFMGDATNILITGSAGWLAQFVYEDILSLPFHTKCFGTYHAKKPSWIPEECLVHMDLGDSSSVESALGTLRPDIIIHLAAMSTPGQCHQDPARAHIVNNSTSLVDAVKRIIPSSLFIYTSTDLVYDGEKGTMYSPHDEAFPRTVYGQSKLAFEEQILKLQRGIVLRLSNMIGPKYAYQPAGCKFMQWLVESFRSRTVVGLRHDEIRSFVFVYDVTRLICQIILQHVSQPSGGHVSGVYNVGGPQGLSRLDLARIVAESAGCLFVCSMVQPTAEEILLDTAGTWQVFKTTNAESVRASGIENPREVVMNSSLTVDTFGVTFRSMSDVIPELLRIKK